jgi:hypothetical protein
MMRWRRAVAHRRRGQPCSCEARPAILRMSTRSMPTKGNNQFFRACSGVLDALLSFHCETNLSADTLIVFPSDQRPYGATASKPRAILIVPPNRAQNLSASSCGRSLLWTCGQDLRVDTSLDSQPDALRLPKPMQKSVSQCYKKRRFVAVRRTEG